MIVFSDADLVDVTRIDFAVASHTLAIAQKLPDEPSLPHQVVSQSFLGPSCQEPI